MDTNLSTKEQLVVAATELLDKGGPGAVTLRAVGDAIGVSQTAPYRHFKDRRSLMEAVARESFRQVAEVLEGAMRSANSPLDAVIICVREYFVLARRYPLRHRLLFEISEQGGLELEAQRAFDTVTALITAAQSAGQVQEGDPTQLSALICSTVHGLANFELIGHGKKAAIVSDADSLTQLLLNLIVKRPQDTQPRLEPASSPESQMHAAA
jgi:AcrR family transcriptional regulator